MKWGTKIKYTAFIVLCSLAFAVSGISGVFSSFKTEGTSGFSIYYTAPEPVNLKAIQFNSSYSSAKTITFDYYNDEYNTIIANATSSSKVDANSDGSIMLYMVGTDIYVLSDGEIYANAACFNMFYRMSSLTSIQFNNFNTSNVTNMSYIFASCSKLTSIDVSRFDTSKVGDMSYMFWGCIGLTTLDLSGWDTSKVYNMSYMFCGCSGLTSLDLSPLDTSNVTDMYRMFYGCSGLTSLDLSDWDTSNVTNMSYMFYGCSKLTTIYVSSSWTTSAVTADGYMFTSCTKLVGGTGVAFNGAYVDKSYATIFEYLTHINSKLLKTYASNATSVTFDYYGSNYDEIIASADAVYNVEDKNIGQCTVYQAGTEVYILSPNEIAPIDCKYMCYAMTNLTSIKFNNFNTINVTDMSSMFYGCSGLTSLDLSGFNTSNVTTMSFMFAGDVNARYMELTSLDLSGWDTSSVTNMYGMFDGCSGLTSLDLSSFNTSKVTDMTYMFFLCRALTTIYVSDSWSTTKVTSSTNMFTNCTSLVGGNGTKYSSSYTDKTYARIDTAGQKGYFTAKP